MLRKSLTSIEPIPEDQLEYLNSFRGEKEQISNSKLKDNISINNNKPNKIEEFISNKLSKSDFFINKLKNLKNKLSLAKDPDSTKELEDLIYYLQDENLETELLNLVIDHETTNPQDIHALNSLATYSNIGNENLKISDIIKIKSNNKHKTMRESKLNKFITRDADLNKTNNNNSNNYNNEKVLESKKSSVVSMNDILEFSKNRLLKSGTIDDLDKNNTNLNSKISLNNANNQNSIPTKKCLKSKSREHSARKIHLVVNEVNSAEEQLLNSNETAKFNQDIQCSNEPNSINNENLKIVSFFEEKEIKNNKERSNQIRKVTDDYNSNDLKKEENNIDNNEKRGRISDFNSKINIDQAIDAETNSNTNIYIRSRSRTRCKGLNERSDKDKYSSKRTSKNSSQSNSNYSNSKSKSKSKNKSKSKSKSSNVDIVESEEIELQIRDRPRSKNISQKDQLKLMKNSFLPSEWETLNNLLNDVANPDFNVFELEEIAETNTMFIVAEKVFERLGYFRTTTIMDRFEKNDTITTNNNIFRYLDNLDQRELVNRRIFFNFVNKLVDGYSREVLYHNDLHATDVFQTSYTMYYEGNIKEKLQLEDIDTLSLFLACLCHDYKHPGLNNSYQFNSQSEIALTYNGKF